jgi:pyruvate ferredoxin oxidoreductase alpha subunit
LIEAYRCEGADVILVTSGSVAGTARVAVDSLREKGRKVGLVKIRLFRPFPKDELLGAVREAEKVAVLDRSLSLGIGGIFAQEVRASFCNEKKRPPIFSYITGLGGRDVTMQMLNDVFYQTYQLSEPPEQSVWIGMRS